MGQLGLRLDAELSGAFVKFTGEMHRQRAGAPKRGEGWGEAGQVDGDDALVEIGVESAAAVREITGERRQPSGGSAYRAHEFVTYQLSPRRQALAGWPRYRGMECLQPCGSACDDPDLDEWHRWASAPRAVTGLSDRVVRQDHPSVRRP